MSPSSTSTAYSQIKPEPSVDHLTVEDFLYRDGSPHASEEQPLSREKSTSFKVNRGLFHEAWQLTLNSGVLAGTVVLLVNLIVLIIVYTKFGVVDNASVVFEGSCTTTSRATIASHVIINILSTLLLAYSNYAMQCVSAPTRKEVDKAHSRRRWLSIGTPTIRNLIFVSPWKSCLWILLCISSFPLHLLWNSTVFQTQINNDYFAISVMPDIFNVTDSALSVDDSLAVTSQDPSDILNVVRHFRDLAGQQSSATLVERLDVEDCIKAYNTDALTSRRNLLLIIDPVNVTSIAQPILAAYSTGTYVPFQWMCDSSFDGNVFIAGGGWNCPERMLETISSGQQWIPGQSDISGIVYGTQDGNSVQFCYSEKIRQSDQHCKINVVPIFLIVVIICNVMKIIGFVLCVQTTKKNPPLLTTGDAIASFLDRPDAFTKGRCLTSKYDYDRIFLSSKEWHPRPIGISDIWEGGRYRWGKAIRGIHWTFSVLVVSTLIILAGALLGPDGIGSGTTETWSSIGWLGIGNAHRSFELGDPGQNSLLSTFLAANWPQLVVSYIYLFLSNMFTTMTAMAEFCAFSQKAQGLRVSAPKKNSEQKSTYFLTLPYRYALPLIGSVATLHYFVSEMVFLAQINVYDPLGNFDSFDSTTGVFFSPLAMFVSVSLGSAIVLVLILTGVFKKYPSTPLAGCCSASIAAACQPLPGTFEFPEGMALRKLKWGVVSHDRNGVGHATFSDAEVEPLQIDHNYA